MALKRIDQLSSAAAISGAELIPVIQNGVTKQVSINSILTSSPAVGQGTFQIMSINNNTAPLAGGNGTRTHFNSGNPTPAITTRTRHVALFDVDEIQILMVNAVPDSTVQESASQQVTYNIGIQRMGSTVTDESTQIMRLSYNGNVDISVPPGGHIVSDPLAFPLSAGEVFYVRVCLIPTAPEGFFTTGNTLNGSGATTFTTGFQSGEGYTFGNAAFAGSALVDGTQINIGGPHLILGRSPVKHKTVAIYGDSIGGGTGDGGTTNYLTAGTQSRLCGNQTALIMTAALLPNQSPNFPYFNACRGGSKGSDWIKEATTRRHRAFLQYVTTVLWQHANNDLSSDAAVMKADTLAAAALCRKWNKKFLAFTVLPNTNQNSEKSGWTTISGQTIDVGTYSGRQAYNAWLRDSGPTGFIAQAGGTDYVDVLDGCQYIEVNASNQLVGPAGGGGYIKLPSQIGLYPGTITNSNPTQYTGSSLNGLTGGSLKGYALRMTSGAALTGGDNGRVLIINNNSSGMCYCPSFSVQPSIGDTYVIDSAVTSDGLHHGEEGYMLMANGLNNPTDLAKFK